MFSLLLGCYEGEPAASDGDGGGTDTGGEAGGPGGGPGGSDDSESTTGASTNPSGTDTNNDDDTAGSEETGNDTGTEPDPDSEDPFDGLPEGEDQWDYICSQGWGDPVSTAFCAGASPPDVTSLADLQQLLGLTFPSNYGNADMGNPAYAIIGHSTSIAARMVTPLNPRTIIFTPPTGPLNDGGATANPDYVMLAFVRGEGFVELISKDPTAGGEMRFFLFKFDHSCEVAGDCTSGDLYTPTWESSWDDYTLYDGDTIRNTIFDCKQCHQPNGPDTQSILLMREIIPDWGHWFYPESPGNLDILDAFRAVRGIDESYGGIPAIVQWSPQHGTQSQSRPMLLHAFLRHNGFENVQPIEYDMPQIDSEIAASGTSPTWDALYDQAVQGNVPPVPHWDGLITDAGKLAVVTTAYQDYLNGVIGQDDLPDLGDVWNDAILDDVSIRPKPGLNGREIMVHMCQHCHNSSLDQNISRARFNVELLDQLSQEVKDEAVYRLMLSDTKAGKMPPVRFHELSDAERDLVIAELEG